MLRQRSSVWAERDHHYLSPECHQLSRQIEPQNGHTPNFKLPTSNSCWDRHRTTMGSAAQFRYPALSRCSNDPSVSWVNCTWMLLVSPGLLVSRWDGKRWEAYKISLATNKAYKSEAKSKHGIFAIESVSTS